MIKPTQTVLAPSSGVPEPDGRRRHVIPGNLKSICVDLSVPQSCKSLRRLYRRVQRAFLNSVDARNRKFREIGGERGIIAEGEFARHKDQGNELIQLAEF